MSALQGTLRSRLGCAVIGVFAFGCSSNSDTPSTPDGELPPSITEPSAAPAADRCVPPPIDRFKELAIVEPSVLEDEARTKPGGVWSFGHLAAALAKDAESAPDFVEAWFNEWTTTTAVNSFTVTPKPGVSRLLQNWPRSENGKLDLARSPFRLLAIMNRLDLRDKLRPESAGEGRFVFAALEGEQTTSFTIIFEYTLPTSAELSATTWAQRFHALGALPFGPAYNDSLERVTRGFTDRNAAPDRVNGSAIGQVRTNEISLGDPWELREFRLDRATGQLRSAPTFQCPDQSFNHDNSALTQFILDHADDVRRGTHVVPAEMLGGVAPETSNSVWVVKGVDEELRHAFALQTCNGCHNGETKNIDGFFQISPNGVGAARLSAFLNDPAHPEADELSRRAGELSLLLCGVSEDHSPPSSGPASSPEVQ